MTAALKSEPLEAGPKPSAEPKIMALNKKSQTRAAMPRLPDLGERKRIDNLERLLQLEEGVRDLATLRELGYYIVNESFSVLDCRQIVLFRVKRKRAFAEKISNISGLDKASPLLNLMEDAVSKKLETLRQSKGKPLSLELEATRKSDVVKAPFRHMLVAPLVDRKGVVFGVMGCLRAKPFEDRAALQIIRLAKTYGHAWLALQPRPVARRHRWTLKTMALLACAVAVCALFIPVPLTALAPVEVVARNPFVVAAPMNGVVQSMTTTPSARVKKGDELFRYVDTDLKSAFEIAQRKLDVAQAKLATALQRSFSSREGRKQVAVMRTEVELAETELAHANSQLDLTIVRAPASGVAIFDRQADWQGRPVSLGERVIEIADPQSIEFRIELPVNDAILLRENAAAKIFLDSTPLDPINATVTTLGYRAAAGMSEVPSYKLLAQADDERISRIGSRGTAQVFGEESSLGFYLFRKPLAAARQFFGF